MSKERCFDEGGELAPELYALKPPTTHKAMLRNGQGLVLNL